MAIPAPAAPAQNGLGCSDVTLAALRRGYASGALTPTQVVEQVLARIEDRDDQAWISLRPADELLMTARRLEAEAQAAGGLDRLPLYGIPIGVKDSIDVAGLPTTLACPDFAYRPDRTATAVERLTDAGAIVIGKTNLDQFATGLVGARSPYGACESVFGQGMISGGSSSGSAVAVASGVVPIAVATDTAGSGRVPAALNGIVGFKPTLGLISTAGLVPACRSIDCVTVMSRNIADALSVLRVAGGADPDHPWSRPDAALTVQLAQEPLLGRVRLGLPDPSALEFFGDESMRRSHLQARTAAVDTLDATVIDVDLDPFFEAGSLLYDGPWVAERYADLGDFIRTHPDSVLPVIRTIIEGSGATYSAAELFRAQHRLKALRHVTGRVWQDVDALVLPTVGTTFTIEEVLAEPIARNTMLGRYTQFANLLNLAALSIPAGTTADGRPVALMLIGPAKSDLRLARIAARILGEQLPEEWT